MNKWLAALGLVAMSAGNMALAASQPIETAQATSVPVRIEVLTACRNDDAVFTIRNHGESWPDSVRLMV